MPAIPQRDALDTLSKARLAELADAFELDVPARSAKSVLVDALAASHRSSYERILEALSRDELKAICRAGGLDDSGKVKASIVDRILGRGEAESASKPAPKAASPRRGPKPKQAELAYDPEEPDGNGKMTLQKLESHLWGAANILRGAIDAADFKHYIFGLLFYKRLCDVWQEVEFPRKSGHPVYATSALSRLS